MFSIINIIKNIIYKYIKYIIYKDRGHYKYKIHDIMFVYDTTVTDRTIYINIRIHTPSNPIMILKTYLNLSVFYLGLIGNTFLFLLN